MFEPAEGLMTGVVQNQDSYMKGRIGQRAYYASLAPAVAEAMAEWTMLTGRRYAPVAPYRIDEAEELIVSMGTLDDTTRGVVDALRLEGRRVGCIAVTCFRPFPAAELAAALGEARTVAIVERTDEPAAADNPLTRETKAALYASASAGARVPRILSVSAGLGSRDVGPGDLAAVFDWLAEPAGRPSDYAVLGIRHPLALAPRSIDIRPPGAFSLRGHSIGGFGSVTTNKLIATLIGELFHKQVQAYPRYGSEKKGLPTTYYLTIADGPIRTHGELDRVDLVPLHDVSAFGLGDPLAGLVDGGTLFLQSTLTDPAEIWASIPTDARAEIVRRRIRVTALDTAGLARARSPRPDLVLRMQGIALVGVFLRVTPFAADAGLDRDALRAAVRERLGRFFGKRGRAVIDANLALIGEAYDGLIDVSAALKLPAGIERHPVVHEETALTGVAR
jgi:pyruvate-ferredoxin/flavodoxin oxidoreductase